MNTIQIPEGHVLTDLGNGSYRIDPVKKGPWEIKDGDRYDLVCQNGHIDTPTWEGDCYDKKSLAFHNVFPVGTGKAAAKQIKYAMAQARAKAIVEPEFEADWNNVTQDKYMIFYTSYRRWAILCFQINQIPTAHYSTEAKAKEAIELLEQWGVKP